MSARFEIVRTNAPQPWHARYIAPNGRTLWTTETYTRRGSALNAISSVVEAFGDCWIATWWYPTRKAMGIAVVYRRDSWNKTDGLRLEIRDADERPGTTE